ncbi:hypothetical protein MYRA21_2405 [Myroides sp. A21]|nr:hypothetical protein MYRA21_2405 [Myroides sp. A21]
MVVEERLVNLFIGFTSLFFIKLKLINKTTSEHKHLSILYSL